MAEPDREPQQTLDLVGQLLARLKFWGIVAAFTVIGAIFTAGGTVMLIRDRAADLVEAQQALKKAFEARVIEGDTYTARAAEADAQRDKMLTEMAITQASIVKIIDRMLDDDRRSDPHNAR